MEKVAYIYFKTPRKEEVSLLFQSIISLGLKITHFGVRDPPKRVSLGFVEMATALLKQPEINKIAFIKDSSQNLSLDFQLNYDSRWNYSTISISCLNEAIVHNIAKNISKKIDAFLCIEGLLGSGKNQTWEVVYESSDCPNNIKEDIKISDNIDLK